MHISLLSSYNKRTTPVLSWITYLFNIIIIIFIIVSNTFQLGNAFVPITTPCCLTPSTGITVPTLKVFESRRHKRREKVDTTTRTITVGLKSQVSSSSSSVVLENNFVLSSKDLQTLVEKEYVIIPNFLSKELSNLLREDIQTLRQSNKFKSAKIGQDSTNQLNTNIRIAETCFLGKQKLLDVPNVYRNKLYEILDQMQMDITKCTGTPLDTNLSELLYAYYPKGGYYRRHRDAVRGSASTLRTYSLLLYLNYPNWSKQDGGELRMHFDGGEDDVPVGVNPNYLDVDPHCGTLVLFKSDAIPHEVLDTQKERMVVVGWYNRPMTTSDIGDITDIRFDPKRIVMLTIAAALVSVGILNIFN